MHPDLVQSLVRDIERKDLSTAAHTWRVVLYTRALAEHLGYPDSRMQGLTHAAALHDLGKLEIPDRILQKPGRLTPEEFEIIKIHPVSGYAHLLTLGVEDAPILDLVRYHHERWDGLGYPYGMKGEEIPPEARYFSVIDTFDALTSFRPYRRQVGEAAAENALAELAAGAGTRYFPDAVDAFTRLYRGGRLDYILHHFNDASPAAYDHAQAIEPKPLVRPANAGPADHPG